jgi:hypothetical protein
MTSASFEDQPEKNSVTSEFVLMVCDSRKNLAVLKVTSYATNEGCDGGGRGSEKAGVFTSLSEPDA